MKRYDYGGCDECSFGQLEESPEGDWMDADEVQARDLKLADLVRAFECFEDCASRRCVECSVEEAWYTHADYPDAMGNMGHKFVASECNCPRGELLAMLDSIIGEK